jgi:hypothetical protein
MVINHLIIYMPVLRLIVKTNEKKCTEFYLSDNHAFQYRHFGFQMKRKISIDIWK